jgi:hypothetical protein
MKKTTYIVFGLMVAGFILTYCAMRWMNGDSGIKQQTLAQSSYTTTALEGAESMNILTDSIVGKPFKNTDLLVEVARAKDGKGSITYPREIFDIVRDGATVSLKCKSTAALKIKQLLAEKRYLVLNIKLYVGAQTTSMAVSNVASAKFSSLEMKQMTLHHIGDLAMSGSNIHSMKFEDIGSINLERCNLNDCSLSRGTDMWSALGCTIDSLTLNSDISMDGLHSSKYKHIFLNPSNSIHLEVSSKAELVFK